MSEREIKINGMTCSGCIRSVEIALKRTGAENIDVTLGTARIRFGNDDSSLASVVEAIEDAGFEIDEIKEPS